MDEPARGERVDECGAWRAAAGSDRCVRRRHVFYPLVWWLLSDFWRRTGGSVIGVLSRLSCVASSW